MVVKRAVSFYKKNERTVSSLALIGGFVFDILTIRRVDTAWENFWILTHLLVVAGAILVVNRERGGPADSESTLNFWATNLMQFSFGGLLSVFLILYFRGATLSVSWPFVLILVMAFILNERLRYHLQRLVLQVSLFFFLIFLFLIFIVPVLIGTMGPLVFILSGALSLLVLRLYLILLERVSGENLLHSLKMLRVSVVSIFALINILYFANIIPPLPLSLVEGDIYHLVMKDEGGNYLTAIEKKNFTDYFRLTPVLHIGSSRELYAFSAIFSPAKIGTTIKHEWQRWDEEAREWESVSSVRLSISGGRDSGYRTYSVGRVEEGKWRVNIMTESDQSLGRIVFRVEETPAKLPLLTEVH